ncbi:MAG: IS1380 family transposase [Magnetococcales bacterium]|nr:IS1380 family transposase [Magnetococcales bacterium]
MGERVSLPGPSFNRSVKIESRAERLSSDGGALVLRECWERLGMFDWLSGRIVDVRDPNRITHPLSELLSTHLLMLGQGWTDQNDANALRDDPAFLIGRSEDRGVAPLMGKGTEESTRELASQATLSRLVEMLSCDRNRSVLEEALVVSAGRRVRAMRGHRLYNVTIDVDSLSIEVDGNQTGSAYNGYYRKQVYHPLMATLGDTGDIVGVSLRAGNVHTADGVLAFVLPIVERVEREVGVVAAVRVDAGMPDEEFCAGLEKAGKHYVARIRNNKSLDRLACPWEDRFLSGDLGPDGFRLDDGTCVFEAGTYQAGSWSRPRRVVLVMRQKPDELLPHYFWLLTSWSKEQIPAWRLLPIYRQRGTAEGYMGEMKDVLDPALSSTNRVKRHYQGKEIENKTAPRDAMAANAVLLLMNCLAYNMIHVVRVLLEKQTKEDWSLQRTRATVLKVATRFLVHSRRITVVIARSATRWWQGLWMRLASLRPPPCLARMA